jgi:disease resistance protein
MAETQKNCKNPGCKQKYLESENHDQACKYHSGKPMFHDLKKGWTCCNKIAYDWDEFEALERCAVGRHDDKSQQAGTGQDQFFKSNTVQNAANAIVKDEQRVKSIDEYNREQEAIQEQLKQKEPEKKPFVTPQGKHKCSNKGCLKDYDPNENVDEACKYHPGEPVFHDLMKSWTCCKKETWDWDEFVKRPQCATGKHVPKLV